MNDKMLFCPFVCLFLMFGRTLTSQCPNGCDCSRYGRLTVDCTGRNLDGIPQDLPCNAGIVNLGSNFIVRLTNKSFSCQRNMNSLVLSHNHLQHIEYGVFEETEELVFLELDSNYLLGMPYLGPLPLLRQVSVSRNYLIEWPQQSFSNTPEKHISTIRLAYNNLHRLPLISFKVALLDLEGNAITDLSEAMLAYPEVITTLDIRENNVEYLNQFQIMANLKILYLDFNQIRNITDNVFTRLPSLETIKMRGNKITDASAFRDMLYVKHISLEDNLIRSVGILAFTNIPEIDTINLIGNEIVGLAFDLLQSVPNSLLVSNNRLRTMETRHGRNYSEMTVLNVDYNDLSNIPVYQFPALTRLYAGYNRITDVTFCEHGHQNLRFINLAWNKITNIKNFGNLPKVRFLLLHGNSLTSWEDTYLINSSHLFSLDLSNNWLSVLSHFTSLPALESLDLSSNVLHTIANGTFESLPRLATLNLTHNRISSLGFLRSMISLIELSLNRNRIVVINSDDFENLIHLRSLHLSFNLIEEINTLNLRSLHGLDVGHNLLSQINIRDIFNRQKLLYVNINDNRIRQIISTSALQIFANNNVIGSYNSSLISGTNIFACNNNMKDFNQVRISRILVGLYLSKNQISRIPDFTFVSASSLMFLELDDNFIVDLHSSAFTGLVFVQRLNLQRNRLIHLSTGVFSQLEELVTLQLGGNPLMFISNRPFSALAALRHIGLSSMPFSNMSFEMLEDLRSVQYLDLQNNSAFRLLFINTTSNLDILELPNLVHLNLSSNELGKQCITLSLKRVNGIDLSNNLFDSIPKHCLPRVSSAYNLRLSHNKITSISRDSFDIHQQFWLLDLSYNRIVSFELGTLQHQTYLISLYLKGNLLTKLDVNFLTFSMKSIFVDVRDNPWSCDCDLITIIRALSLYPQREPLVCEKPSTDVNSSAEELLASDTFVTDYQPKQCFQTHQTLLVYAGDTSVEIPCPIITVNQSDIIHWSVVFHLQQAAYVDATLPDGVTILSKKSLLITRVTKNMTGLYSCWSENEDGQTSFTANLLVGNGRMDSRDQTLSNITFDMSTDLGRNLSKTLSSGKATGLTNSRSHTAMFPCAIVWTIFFRQYSSG